MERVNTLIHRIIFPAALILPILYFVSLIRGFYFSGDTVSFLQYGTGALKLHFWDVFLIHGNQWPPLPAMFYNMLQILPGGFITEQKAYLIIFFLLNLSACYFLAKRYFSNFSERVIITSLLLFSSLQALLLRVSLADIQFMAMWLWSLVFLDYFIQTKKERYIALFIIPASLIPMTRYAGLPVTLTLSALLIIYSLINYKKYKFSPYFTISAALFILIPAALYLFRNLMATHALFGYYEPQRYEVDRLRMVLDRIILLTKDISLPLLSMSMIGIKISWRKDYTFKIILLFLPVFIYLYIVIYQQFQYRVTEFIPSRYTSPFYPILLLTGLLFGSWLSSKYKVLKRLSKISCLFITLILLGTIYYSSFRYFIAELGFSSYKIPETEYSQNLYSFCNLIPGKNKYLFLQYDSRNWSAHGLYFFCKPITWITMTEEKITLPKDSVVFSPYKLTDTNLTKIQTYYGHRNINLYIVITNTEFNIKKELARLGSILQ